MQIIRASQDHLSEVARLFDQYRQFYHCDPDLNLAASFIQARMENNDSAIFLAISDQQEGAGFVQLYASFCSVEAVKIEILYDLFVAAEFRKLGIGRMLMERATRHAQDNGASRIDLLTAKDNFPGQALYESLGYVKTNQNFHAYSLAVKP